MRKRLLIKNFVTQMLDQEKQMSKSGREQLVSDLNPQQLQSFLSRAAKLISLQNVYHPTFQ